MENMKKVCKARCDGLGLVGHEYYLDLRVWTFYSGARDIPYGYYGFVNDNMRNKTFGPFGSRNLVFEFFENMYEVEDHKLRVLETGVNV